MGRIIFCLRRLSITWIRFQKKSYVVIFVQTGESVVSNFTKKNQGIISNPVVSKQDLYNQPRKSRAVLVECVARPFL